MKTAYKNQTWAVTIDRPYYPSIEYFTTETDAVTRASQLRSESDDGAEAAHEVTICVVKIVSSHSVKTSF